MRAALVPLLLASGVLSGCATLARGTVDQYNISTQPGGAVATTSLGSSCRTPCALPVDRHDAFSVTIALAGYRTQTIDVGTRLSSSGAAHAVENVGNAGLGLLVDAATGAAMEHTPGQISVALRPL